MERNILNKWEKQKKNRERFKKDLYLKRERKREREWQKKVWQRSKIKIRIAFSFVGAFFHFNIFLSNKTPDRQKLLISNAQTNTSYLNFRFMVIPYLSVTYTLHREMRVASILRTTYYGKKNLSLKFELSV